MIAPLHVLLITRSADDSDATHLSEPLRRAGYQPVIEQTATVEGLSVALADRRWDAILISDPPEDLSPVDILAWLERCRASTPLIVLTDDLSTAESFTEMGVSEVLERTQWHQLGLVLSRARRSADVAEGTSFRTIASRVPIAVHRTGIDGRVLFANRALADLLGAATPEDIVGRHLQYEFGFPRDAFLAEMQRSGEVTDLLVSWRKSDGKSILVRETAWARRDPSGTVTFYEGMIEVMPLPEVAGGDGDITYGGVNTDEPSMSGAEPQSAAPRPDVPKGSHNGSNRHFAWAAPVRKSAPQPSEEALSAEGSESVAQPAPAAETATETHEPPVDSTPDVGAEPLDAATDPAPVPAAEPSPAPSEPVPAAEHTPVIEAETERADLDEHMPASSTDDVAEEQNAPPASMSEENVALPEEATPPPVPPEPSPEPSPAPVAPDLAAEHPPAVEAEEESTPQIEHVPAPPVSETVDDDGVSQADVAPETPTAPSEPAQKPPASSKPPPSQFSPPPPSPFENRDRLHPSASEFGFAPDDGEPYYEQYSRDETARAPKPTKEAEVDASAAPADDHAPDTPSAEITPPVQTAPPEESPSPETVPSAQPAAPTPAVDSTVEASPEAAPPVASPQPAPEPEVETHPSTPPAAQQTATPAPAPAQPAAPQAAPASEPPAAAPPQEATPPTVTAEEKPSARPQRLKMLVVEDNMDTRQLLQRVLKPHYEVDMVADARSAIDHMSKRRYDVLLMDIHLGGKETGADVLRVARKLPGYDSTTAIAVTAYALPGDRDSLLEAGFNGYVSKPFTVQALLATLEQAGAVTAVAE